jgi:hypothetical protein
MQPAKLAQVQ